MVEREHVLTVLRKRFPNATAGEIAAAANAIAALPDEWQEVPVAELPCGDEFPAQRSDTCDPAEQSPEGVPVRVFRRRSTKAE